MRDLLRFKKPDNPTVPISSDFYLSVLASNAVAPTLNSLMNPKGVDGGIVGLSVPLMQDSNIDELARPISRGVYGLSSLDKKTVIKMRAFSHEEAHFDPESVLSMPSFQSMDSEIVQRIRATWTIYQLTFESYDPALFPSLNMFINTVARLGILTEGAIADPLAMRYLLPQHFMLSHDNDFYVQNFVGITKQSERDECRISTKGLSKFDQREIELTVNNMDVAEIASQFLLSVANGVVHGQKLDLGDKLISEEGWIVSEGLGPNTFELIPMKGTSEATLENWKASHE